MKICLDEGHSSASDPGMCCGGYREA